VSAPLEIRGLTRRYGGVTAVDGVDIDVPAGAVTALVGPNGAGKSTLFRCACGIDRAATGRVALLGTDISRLPPHARVRRGLAWTSQQPAVFDGLSVAENLLVGAENRDGRPLIPGLLGLAGRGAGEARATVVELLTLLDLVSLRDVPAGELPLGTARMVELGRALATRPRVLLLDEPASGLDDAQVATLSSLLRRLAVAGLAIMLVEHDLELVGRLADHVVSITDGRIA
jgi:branched-chain amino acid transport system ATP-binding protein